MDINLAMFNVACEVGKGLTLTSKWHLCCRDNVMLFAYVNFHHNKSFHPELRN